jgi:hypothetical protein
MRTSGVKIAGDGALACVAKPYREDVIAVYDDVFQAIENQPTWRGENDELCVDLGKTVINN